MTEAEDESVKSIVDQTITSQAKAVRAMFGTTSAEAVNWAMGEILKTPAQPKLSEARRLENAIVAARLDAFEASDMIGAIIASLLARYGEENDAFYDIKNYSTKMEAAIMELDK